jgi:hypothetical protein
VGLEPYSLRGCKSARRFIIFIEINLIRHERLQAMRVPVLGDAEHGGSGTAAVLDSVVSVSTIYSLISRADPQKPIIPTTASSRRAYCTSKRELKTNRPRVKPRETIVSA